MIWKRKQRFLCILTATKNKLLFNKLTYYICTDNIFINYLNQNHMWVRSHSIISKDVTKEQLWKLFSNVNQWHIWDAGIDFASIDGEFEKGNHFILKPKGGPKVKIELVETLKNKGFTDYTRFPLAKMYGKHEFIETQEGLKITTTMTVTGILGFLWVKLVAKGIADALPAEMLSQVQYAKTL